MKFTAVSLRLFLSISLVLVAGITITLIWLGSAQLKIFAAEVSQTTSDANASRNSLQTLQKIKQELTNQKLVIDKASSIVADSKGYKYQDQIIKDLNEYAAASGLMITNFSFTTVGAGAAGTATPSLTPPPSGVKTTSASITLKPPIHYVNLLQFIHAIEQNLTKMQISRISLSKGGGHDEVVTDALEIQVYIN